MYRPAAFDESRIDVLHAFMDAHPLATLVTQSPEGLTANHIPLLLKRDADGSARLVGHVARANSLWREHDGATDALAIFQGPQHYISPNWYATKAETHRVVPTWNYAAVHAWGPLTVIDDADWLRQQLVELTQRHESGQPQPWEVADAPRDFIDQLVRAIVGIEIPIRRLEGKWKVSQNQPERNRTSVTGGLGAADTPAAREIAALVRERGPKA